MEIFEKIPGADLYFDKYRQRHSQIFPSKLLQWGSGLANTLDYPKYSRCSSGKRPLSCGYYGQQRCSAENSSHFCIDMCNQSIRKHSQTCQFNQPQFDRPCINKRYCSLEGDSTADHDGTHFTVVQKMFPVGCSYRVSNIGCYLDYTC